MKQTIIAVLILFCISARAQKKEIKDSVAKDTIVVLSLQQANQLIQDIQIQMSGKADIKNEQWLADLKMIFGSAHISEKPKTTK